MADIEKPDAIAHRQVLGDDAGILDGHIPAAKIDHSGTRRAVHRVQRSFFEHFVGKKGKLPSYHHPSKVSTKFAV